MMKRNVQLRPTAEIGSDERDEDEREDMLLAFPARLNRIHGLILQGLEVPLTFRQYRTISRVASGYSSMSQLAARANLSMAAVSEGVFALVKRGLLKTSQGVGDRRTVVIEATPAGVAAIAAGSEALKSFREFLTVELDEGRLDELYTVLTDLYWRATEFYATDSAPEHKSRGNASHG